MFRPALACILAATAFPAVAQDADYIDDRSSPAALMRSLYNAINRREYARAWSYFAQPPAADLEAYAAGYADTQTVELITGVAREEGTAGSFYYQLPVAIRAQAGDGSARVFSGCYTMRLQDPSVAGDAFEPMHIESATLRPSDAELDEALPRKCGDGEELPQLDPVAERAKAIFDAAAVDKCDIAPAFDAEDAEPDNYTLTFRYEHDDDDQPERTARLFRFLCYRGAYNESHLYYLFTEKDGVQPLHFAKPAFDIHYVDDDREGAVDHIALEGFSATADLVNSAFDPATLTITEFSKWRGVGDAGTSGTWQFKAGTFRLVHYAVDGSYDGEINPEVIVDYESAP